MPTLAERAMAPKSDQLNADDLIVGTIDVTILKITALPGDKMAIHIDGGRMPWHPCKGMVRLMAFCWDEKDEQKWIGNKLRLYRDPNVVYAGETVGGIRVSHVSKITEPKTIKITVSRNKRETVTVLPLHEKPVSVLDVYRKQMKGHSAPVLAIGKKIADAFTAKDATAFDAIGNEITQITDETANKLLSQFLADALAELMKGGAK